MLKMKQQIFVTEHFLQQQSTILYIAHDIGEIHCFRAHLRFNY